MLAAAAESNNSNDNVKKSVKNQSYIDAVVEERTAGLAEVDEENTSVSYGSLVSHVMTCCDCCCCSTLFVAV